MDRIGEIGVYRVDGAFGLDQAVRMVADRLSMVRDWAAAAQGRLTIALVTSPGLIDPERIGVVAASGFGLAGDVFTSEAPALAWLDELP